MQWLKKHKRSTGTAAALFLILVFWALSYGGDSQLAKVQELKKQLTSEEAKKLAPEQRRELWKQFNEQVKQLSPDQRRELGKEAQRAFDDKLRKFFAMSKTQQRTELDREIDRMEAARKKWEQNKQKGGGKGPGTNGPGAQGKGKSLDPQQREHARKQRLEHTTPEHRAMMAEHSRLLKQRREQRGMPPMGGKGR